MMGLKMFSEESDIKEYVNLMRSKNILSLSEILPNLLEIRLNQEDGFLIIKETLTRIGIPSYKQNTLYQTCHILHKKGRYYITHFKELFMLDGRPTNLSEEDIYRRNAIAQLLSQWGFCQGVNWDDTIYTNDLIKKTKIISFVEKKNWTLESKHPLGKNTNEKS